MRRNIACAVALWVLLGSATAGAASLTPGEGLRRETYRSYFAYRLARPERRHDLVLASFALQLRNSSAIHPWQKSPEFYRRTLEQAREYLAAHGSVPTPEGALLPRIPDPIPETRAWLARIGAHVGLPPEVVEGAWDLARASGGAAGVIPAGGTDSAIGRAQGDRARLQVLDIADGVAEAVLSGDTAFDEAFHAALGPALGGVTPRTSPEAYLGLDPLFSIETNLSRLAEAASGERLALGELRRAFEDSMLRLTSEAGRLGTEVRALDAEIRRRGGELAYLAAREREREVREAEAREHARRAERLEAIQASFQLAAGLGRLLGADAREAQTFLRLGEASARVITSFESLLDALKGGGRSGRAATAALIAGGNVAAGALTIVDILQGGESIEQAAYDLVRDLQKEVRELSAGMHAQFANLNERLSRMFESLTGQLARLSAGQEAIRAQLDRVREDIRKLDGDIRSLSGQLDALAAAGADRDYQEILDRCLAPPRRLAYRSFLRCLADFGRFSNEFASDAIGAPGAALGVSDREVGRFAGELSASADARRFFLTYLGYFARVLGRPGLGHADSGPLPGVFGWSKAALGGATLLHEYPEFRRLVSPDVVRRLRAAGATVRDTLTSIGTVARGGSYWSNYALAQEVLANYAGTFRTSLGNLQEVMAAIRARNGGVLPAVVSGGASFVGEPPVQGQVVGPCRELEAGHASPPRDIGSLSVPHGLERQLPPSVATLNRLAPSPRLRLCYAGLERLDTTFERLPNEDLRVTARVGLQLLAYLDTTLVAARSVVTAGRLTWTEPKGGGCGLLCWDDSAAYELVRANWSVGERLSLLFETQSFPIAGLSDRVLARLDAFEREARAALRDSAPAVERELRDALAHIDLEVLGAKTVVAAFVELGLGGVVDSHPVLQARLYGPASIPGSLSDRVFTPSGLASPEAIESAFAEELRGFEAALRDALDSVREPAAPPVADRLLELLDGTAELFRASAPPVSPDEGLRQIREEAVRLQSGGAR